MTEDAFPPSHSPLAVPVEVTASQDGDLVPIDSPLGTSLQTCPLRGTGPSPSVVGDTMLQPHYPSYAHSFITLCSVCRTVSWTPPAMPAMTG